MIVSLNEIETVSRKAAVGAGLPEGAAEDFGAAIRALAGNGHPAERLARDALCAFDDGRSAGPIPERTEAGWRIAPPSTKSLAACLAGPAAADLAQAFCTEGDAEIVLSDLDVPEIVAGALAASRGADRGDEPCAWLIQSGSTVELVAGPAIVSLPSAPAPPSEDPGTITVRRADGRSAGGHARPSPGTAGITVDPTSWHALEALAARCLVPESETSRTKGAGAGLIDAD